MHKSLVAARLLQEELDHSCQYLELCLRAQSVSIPRLIVNVTHLCELLHERLDEALQDLVGIVDLLSIFTNNPDQRTAGVGLIQLINVLAQRGNDTFVTRVLAQDILDDDNDLLNHIVDLGGDEVLKSGYALLASALDLDGHLTDSLDSSSDKVHIDFQGILLQLGKQLLVVALICYPHHNLQLLELDIWWVSVLAEEDSHLLAQDVGLGLEEEINVSQSDILNLGRRSNQGDYTYVSQNSNGALR